jgi:hypothetical protein
MVKTKHIIICGAVLAAGIIALYVFWLSDEAKIKRKFKFVEEKIEKTGQESPIVSAAKANRIREVCAEKFKIHAPAYSFSREIPSSELSGIVFSTRSRYSEILLKFYDFVIDIAGKDTAQVNVTAGMKGKLTTGELVEDLHELKCKMQKIEDNWRLEEIEIVEVLKK